MDVDNSKNPFYPPPPAAGHSSVKPNRNNNSQLQLNSNSIRNWRQLIPRNPWSKFAIAWSLLQTIICVALESVILNTTLSFNAYISSLNVTTSVQLQTTSLIKNAQALTVYQGLFIVAQLFQFVLAVDAVIHSSTIQLVSTTVFNIVLASYSIIQSNQSSDSYTALIPWFNPVASPATFASKHQPQFAAEVAVMVVMFLGCIGWLIITRRLFRVFGWSIFKELGADVAVKRRLMLYHIFIMLLKLDVFFFIGFSIQFLVLVLGSSASTNMVDILTHGLIAFPGALALLVIAYMAVHRESKILMYATLVGLLAGAGYLISKLVDISRNGETDKYSGCSKSLAWFESITLLLVLATFIVALLNLRNFGKGLMQQLKNKPNLAPIATPNSSSTSRRQQQQHQHSSSLHNNNINSATNSSTTIASPPSSSSLLQPYHSNASVPSRQAPPPPPPSSKKTLPTRWTLE